MDAGRPLFCPKPRYFRRRFAGFPAKRCSALLPFDNNGGCFFCLTTIAGVGSTGGVRAKEVTHPPDVGRVAGRLHQVRARVRKKRTLAARLCPMLCPWVSSGLSPRISARLLGYRVPRWARWRVKENGQIAIRAAMC
eukprot:1818294-Rhodomonas_salina.1